jgi:signal transduction histidine kinase
MERSTAGDGREHDHTHEGAPLFDAEHLLSLTAHELRNPIAALRLQLESLDLSVLGASGDRRVRRAIENTQRLTDLIEGILGLSRLRAGQLSLQRQRIDLFALVLEMVARMREQIERAGCTISAITTDVIVGYWDRFQLELVVTNLLSNAIKFGKSAPIDVVVEAAGPSARLTVRDNGPGVSPDDRARIFDRYARARDVAHLDGAGLGLYISRALAEAHGGTLRLACELGRGAAFQVELPLGAEELA